MFKVQLSGILLLLCLYSVQAQNINGRISLGAYSFERFDSIGNSDTYVRGNQSLALNINKSNYSLRTSLSYEAFQKGDQGVDRFRLYNLYFEGRNLWDMISFKLGRHAVFNGPASGIYDGLSLKGKFTTAYEVNLHYGGILPAYQKFDIRDNFSENYLLAGSFRYMPDEAMYFTLGYFDKNLKSPDYSVTRLDEQFNPVTLLIKQNSNQFSYIFFDAGYNPDFIASGLKLEYDLNFAKLSKAEVNAEYEVTDRLTTQVYGLYREPRIRYNSIFSVFDYGNTYEGEFGAGFKVYPWLTANANFAYINYKDESSQRFGFGFNLPYGNISYRSNLGYAGEMESISLYAAYTFFEGWLTPSCGVSFTNYKLSADAPENNLTTILAGVNVRPGKVVSCDIQTQYLNNKIYKNDLRLLLKLNYWFNTNVSGL